jgi:prepilin-type N-terminal cleavage/methylation domain-containing protein
MGGHRALRARRSLQSGFTLVELTVALVAGLIVALGIVGLSHEATQTFNEESRSSAAEAAMRTAVDRLRADLARAGYMSTGDILVDPAIAHAPTKNNLQNLLNPNFTGMKQLGALTLLEGGSVTTSGLALSASQNPALNPDALLIGGNMTCAEQFDVQMILPPSGSCQQIMLSAVSPAMYRVATTGFTDATGGVQLRNVFAPVTGNGTTAQFMVRLLDDTGHTQYLATCKGGQVAGFNGSGQPFVMIDSADTQILMASDTQGQGGISGFAAGKAWVNPVQLVRWEITSTAQEAINQPQLATALGNVVQTGQLDPNKYDLMRSYVDASTGAVIPQTSEIVAEYAVDLDFAFTVDSSLVGPTKPNLVTYPFDDGNSLLWAPDLSKITSLTATPPVNMGPQRIRSVRARLVTRAALPDRTVNVAVLNQYGTEEYMYRYCVGLPGQAAPNCATNDGSLKWARTRTVTTEVALPNNSGAYY